MTDTVFRTQQTDTAERAPITASEQAKPVPEVQKPYLSYIDKPFEAEYYELGDTWDSNIGGFPKELASIQGYFRDKITNGDIADNVETVKEELKRIEKMTNVSHESRPLVKIETIAAYIEFLKRTSDIKKNITRYGRT
jgi:hypothetical protein